MTTTPYVSASVRLPYSQPDAALAAHVAVRWRVLQGCGFHGAAAGTAGKPGEELWAEAQGASEAGMVEGPEGFGVEHGGASPGECAVRLLRAVLERICGAEA